MSHDDLRWNRIAVMHSDPRRPLVWSCAMNEHPMRALFKTKLSENETVLEEMAGGIARHYA